LLLLTLDSTETDNNRSLACGRCRLLSDRYHIECHNENKYSPITIVYYPISANNPIPVSFHNLGSGSWLAWAKMAPWWYSKVLDKWLRGHKLESYQDRRSLHSNSLEQATDTSCAQHLWRLKLWHYTNVFIIIIVIIIIIIKWMIPRCIVWSSIGHASKQWSNGAKTQDRQT